MGLYYVVVSVYKRVWVGSDPLGIELRFSCHPCQYLFPFFYLNNLFIYF